MRIPQRAPNIAELQRDAVESGQIEVILNAIRLAAPADTDNRYLHWDTLRRLNPPENLSSQEWWLVTKLQREPFQKKVPVTDLVGSSFTYLLPDPAPEKLHQIDLRAGGMIQMPDQITNPETKDRYYISSLIEEAYTSSQLEGAASTREVAKEMIRSKRKPRTEGEQMILNNYWTMKWLGEIKSKPLTPELVCDLHKLITKETLKNPVDEGCIRSPDRPVVVDDIYGEVLHKPPDAQELKERMEAMCRFANGDIPNSFIHPAVRSIILHFWLAYDHPFIDGNGRTARALFYWSMLRHGFWLFEFISISRIILKAPSKYARAFLYTETDENDLTYFILYHLNVINQAIGDLHEYVQRKTQEIKQVEAELRGTVTLNYRQQALISHALRHPTHRYTVESHRTSHNVVYETARTDLQALQKKKLLKGKKVGRTQYFIPHPNLSQQLSQL